MSAFIRQDYKKAYCLLCETRCLFRYLSNNIDMNGVFIAISLFIREQPEASFVKLVYDFVCKESERRACISDCDATISSFFPRSVSKLDRQRVAKQLIMSTGYSNNVAIDLFDMAFEAFGKVTAEHDDVVMDVKVNGDVKQVVRYLVSRGDGELLVKNFLQGNPKHCRLRAMLYEIYADMMENDQQDDYWGTMSTRMLFERIIFHPLWTVVEDSILIRNFIKLSETRTLRNPIVMEGACITLSTLMSEPGMEFTPESIRERMSMWSRLYFDFESFITYPGIEFTFGDGKINVTAEYFIDGAPESLLHNYFRLYAIPWYDNLKVIFVDRQACNEVLPDVCHYIRWDLLGKPI